jgi:arylsulfatase A-like enzyme
MAQGEFTRREVLLGMGTLGAAALLPCPDTPLPSPTATRFPNPTSTPFHTRTPPPTETLRPTEEEQVYIPHLTNTPSPSWEGLSFVIVMCDTLRYDHIGFHGSMRAQTPNIDAFATQALVFDKAYSGGFPTVLNRAELFTGRYTFTYMGWEDMLDDEIVLAQVMNDAGYTTGLVFDTWHLKSHKFSFDRAFGSWQWIRGQEDDRYRTTPLQPTLPAAPEKFRHGTEVIEQYLRNVSKRRDESDHFIARTIQAAKEWLCDNYTQNKFCLYIDAFDPHEPWDPPQHYVDLYNPGYAGEEVIYPAYAPPDYLSADELNHMQALYAAEVTMVDYWLGELFAEIKRLGLEDNTVVVLTSDHGILLGEHNGIGKAWDHQGHYECYPLYEELVHIPLMIRVPGIAPRRIPDLAQPADVMPTILEWAGASDPGTMHGVSLIPTIEDAGGSSHTPAHTSVVSGRSLGISLSAEPRCTVTDGTWTLIYGGKHTSSELYYLPDDPQQETNLLDDQCAIARDLHAELVVFLGAVGTAEEYIDPWQVAPC